MKARTPGHDVAGASHLQTVATGIDCRIDSTQVAQAPYRTIESSMVWYRTDRIVTPELGRLCCNELCRSLKLNVGRGICWQQPKGELAESPPFQVARGD